jgi:hypothetical protein
VEIDMTRRRKLIAAVLGSAALMIAAAAGLAGHYGSFEDDDDDDGGRSALVNAMGNAQISLQQGLAASEQEGQPVSGTFEVEDGKFQLSVYTARDGRFSEVLVDYVTAEVAKAWRLAEDDDLDALEPQSAAMAKAKVPLKDAVAKALSEYAGYRAVGIVPNLKDGHPVASVLLLKADQFKTVSEALD